MFGLGLMEILIILAVVAVVWRGRGAAAGFMFLVFLGLAATVVMGVVAYSRHAESMVARNDPAVREYLEHKAQLGPPTAERAEHPETLDDMWDHLTGSRIELDRPAIPITAAPSTMQAPNASATPVAQSPSVEDQAAAQVLAYLIMQAANSKAGVQKPEEAKATREAATLVSSLLLQAAKSDAGKQAADAAKVAGEKALDSVAVAKSLSVLLNTADQWQTMAENPSPSTPSTAPAPAPTPKPDDSIDLVSDEADPITIGSDSPAPKSAVPRPDWLDRESRFMEDSQSMVLTAGPYASLPEVRQELERQLAEVTMERLRQRSDAPKSQNATFDDLQMPMSELLPLVVRAQFTETSTSPTFFGDMKTTHLLVKFEPETESKLLHAWTEHSRRQGIKFVAETAGGTLGVLALVAGLFRFDTWTRGFYTKRLFLGVPAAIIAGMLALKAAMVGW